MRIKNDEKNKKKTPPTPPLNKQQYEGSPNHNNNNNQNNNNNINISVSSPRSLAQNMFVDDFTNLSPGMDLPVSLETNQIPHSQYSPIRHGAPTFPKHQGQFPDYTSTMDYITPSIDTNSVCGGANDFVDIEPMWGLPKFSSYEALLNDEEDLFSDSYKLNHTMSNATNNSCGVYQPHLLRGNNHNEMNHFNSISNLVYPIWISIVYPTQLFEFQFHFYFVYPILIYMIHVFFGEAFKNG